MVQEATRLGESGLAENSIAKCDEVIARFGDADYASLQRTVADAIYNRAIALVVGGLMLGLVLAAALTRVLASLPMDMPLLFGVGATDAATFAIVTLLLGAAGLLASYMPATLARRWIP